MRMLILICGSCIRTVFYHSRQAENSVFKDIKGNHKYGKNRPETDHSNRNGFNGFEYETVKADTDGYI